MAYRPPALPSLKRPAWHGIVSVAACDILEHVSGGGWQGPPNRISTLPATRSGRFVGRRYLVISLLSGARGRGVEVRMLNAREALGCEARTVAAPRVPTESPHRMDPHACNDPAERDESRVAAAPAAQLLPSTCGGRSSLRRRDRNEPPVLTCSEGWWRGTPAGARLGSELGDMSASARKRVRSRPSGF